MQRKLAIALIIFTILGVGGYFAYEYVKQRPPRFLLEILSSWRPPAPPLPAGDTAPLTVPAGWSATIFARDIPAARVLVRDPQGTMLVSQTKEGKVTALLDAGGDGIADESVTVLENLRQPHGMLFLCPNPRDFANCRLYVAETGKLDVYRYDTGTYRAVFEKTLATFPTGGGHYTRTLLLEPSGKQILASIGSSCNVCEEGDARRASVQAIDVATGVMERFAWGLRNTVFMALHPVTGEVWGTDNGRDLIGDDIPPDEVNIIREGRWYGWPWFYGKNVEDMDFSPRARPSFAEVAIPSHIDLPAHSAALGLAFVPEEGWPEDWWHDLLVAYHGSWNRSEPTGYKVVRIELDPQGNPTGEVHNVVTGFLAEGGDEGDAAGRPVGILAEPGGVFYVSDDRAGAVYRIAWTGR